ncbi:MAG: tRNA pseudouridine(55) synthase TruB [Spirochaetes bacterium]|nr:tRNA pseudouridine(55) synthase TruB [Spirochaetota bacterium]
MISAFNNSVILVDKPTGRTSSDTLNELKKIIKQKKIGHSGTLDKSASGLLVVCTGSATKLTRYFLNSDKRYIGTIKLGIITDSFDSEGKIIERKEIKNLNPEYIKKIPGEFTGETEQVPPLYSALKIGGKRASDIAREGKNVFLNKRKVTIKKLDILKIDLDNYSIKIDVACSKGTYIRSLAMDIGEYLGTGAHLESLQRIASGIFTLENAATIDEIKKSANGSTIDKKYLLTPGEALMNFSTIKIKNIIKKRILNGAFFTQDDIISIDSNGGNPFIILDEEENLIAIADVDINNWLIKYLNVFN